MAAGRGTANFAAVRQAVCADRRPAFVFEVHGNEGLEGFEMS